MKQRASERERAIATELKTVFCVLDLVIKVRIVSCADIYARPTNNGVLVCNISLYNDDLDEFLMITSITGTMFFCRRQYRMKNYLGEKAMGFHTITIVFSNI